MNEYEILNIIGQGAFGNAYLATHIAQNQNYVIKKIELTNKTKEQIDHIYIEVRLLEEFKHVNIVSYRESIKDGQELNIVMEFCHGGDMNQLITEQKEHFGGKKLEERKIIDWSVQIALAIFYMHDKRILHRDLKTPNIFILDNKVKLGDFGISKVLDEKMDLASTSIGTPYYMSPEQYKHRDYSYKSDIWAFGCILYEMCNQKRPFEAYSLNGLAVKVLEAKFTPVSEFYSRELRELINRMLQKKVTDRPSILQFLQTPIIKRRVTVYIKDTYTKLLAEKGDDNLIEGLFYQAKKLGIYLADKKDDESHKKSKPEFSAEKKRQEKDRIRQQLQEELKKMSDKTKQQKQQLRQQITQRNKKKVEPSVFGLGKKNAHGSSKSIKEVSTNPSESRGSSVVAASKVEEKPRQFEIKEKYDMYQMEFEAEVDSEEEEGPAQETIVQVEEDEEGKQEEKSEAKKEVRQAKPDEIEQKKDIKSEVKQHGKKQQKRQSKQDVSSSTKKELSVQEKLEEKFYQRKPKQEEKLKSEEKPYSKERYVKPVQKESRPQTSRFTQLVPQESPSKVPSVPIEEAISHLKQDYKTNMERVNTIKNQISAINFSISSSEDELERTIEQSAQLPVVMRKRPLNPVHVALSDKANDLKQNLEQILPRKSIAQLIELAKARGGQVNRGEIERVVGQWTGTYHLAFELVKLNSMLERVQLYS